MAFTRLLRQLLRDGAIGRRIVPIIPDEARTFGMDPLFHEIKIYSAKGQLYDPVDSNLILSYLESRDGQLLEEGITEAGATASFTAAGTSYATHGEPMIPFYIFYSMFGFQRTGDLVWAFGDARGRGFLMGATAGRTTLYGEGLQHEDGHSHLLFSVMPNVLAYDPAFAYETAVIVRDGLRRMMEKGEDVFYYITLYNENYAMPPMRPGIEEGILRGLYRFLEAPGKGKHRVRLFGSGPILREAVRAREILAEKFDVAAEVWSATSYLSLRNDALSVERWNRLHPGAKPRRSWLEEALGGAGSEPGAATGAGAPGAGARTGGRPGNPTPPVPVIAASDYMKAVPDQIARWVPGPFTSLGTDGFGRSDTREALRRHFEVDAESIAAAALSALARSGRMESEAAARAIRDLGLDAEKPEPRTA
jgi:pyruvate dehydrogenase E1 component